MDYNVLIAITIFFLPLLLLLIVRSKNKKLKEEINNLTKTNTQIITDLETINNQLLTKYGPIMEVEAHNEELIRKAKESAKTIESAAEESLSQADNIRLEANQTLQLASTEANKKIRESREQAHDIKLEARQEANRIVEYAQNQAHEIAGEALIAKSKADSYESAIKAMKNTIEGYKDDYIVPNHSVLDSLADEYSHKEAGEQLKVIRKRVREMVKDGYAGSCDYVEMHRRTYAIHFAVDAFNGKVASALAKVKFDNYGKIKQEILDAFALVNHNGSSFRNARINKEYLDARLTELKWAVAAFELRKIEKEEQAAIKAQIREEERAIREMEKARKEAEKEEKLLQKALEKARAELAAANEEQKAEYESQLAELETKLKEAEEKGQRALSMAQQTRRGHVYVISNVGSFGEQVFKIGMTRRLEPLDRVKELGDASVPFSFDVHAMIYSEDAPALEKELHRQFELDSVNKVNARKEFFKTTIAEVKQAVEQFGVSDVHWTLKAEAAEYKESLAIEEERRQQNVA